MDLNAVTFDWLDLCDRCSARCYSKAFKDGATLQFCLHHIGEHGQTLFDRGWEIVSHTEALEQIGAKVPVYV